MDKGVGGGTNSLPTTSRESKYKKMQKKKRERDLEAGVFHHCCVQHGPEHGSPIGSRAFGSFPQGSLLLVFISCEGPRGEVKISGLSLCLRRTRARRSHSFQLLLLRLHAVWLFESARPLLVPDSPSPHTAPCVGAPGQQTWRRREDCPD